MNCARFDEILAGGDVGTLGPVDRIDFERHLADCPPCASRFRELLLTTEILKGLGAYEDAEVPPPLPEHLVTRIVAARRAAGTAEGHGRRAM